MRSRFGLILPILLTAALTGCRMDGYGALYSANSPSSWSVLSVPYSSDRNDWNDSVLALNSDTWVYAAASATRNYARLITFENPDEDGVGSYIDIEVDDNDLDGTPDNGDEFSDYTVTLGVYQLTGGRTAQANRMEIYGQYVHTFRFRDRADPFNAGGSDPDSTFGAVLDLPFRTYIGLWDIDQTVNQTTLNIDDPAIGAQDFRRLDWVLDQALNGANPDTDFARYAQVFLQASQVLHSGWNGYGQELRSIASVLGSILGDNELSFETRYTSPMGIGSMTVKFSGAFPPLPGAAIEEMLSFQDNYQIVSHILGLESGDSADDYDWHSRISAGSGTGTLAGTIAYRFITNDLSGAVGHDVAIEYGEEKLIGPTSTFVTDMKFDSTAATARYRINVTIDGSTTPLDADQINPGNLDLFVW